MKRKRFPCYLYSLSLSRQKLCKAVAVIITACACAGVPLSSAHVRTLDVVSPWDIKSPEPTKSGSTFLGMEFVETLTTIDLNGNQRPYLSTEWSVSLEQRKCQFSLRKGGNYHDESSVTAEAVVKSLLIASNKPGRLRKAPIKEIVGEGDFVSITLEQPYVILPSVLFHYTTAILAPAAYREDGGVKEFIGTGPYNVLYIEPPPELLARSFRQYWDEKPKIQATRYFIVSRNETRTLMGVISGNHYKQVPG